MHTYQFTVPDTSEFESIEVTGSASRFYIPSNPPSVTNQFCRNEYSRLRHYAKRKNIQFDLSLQQWVDIWFSSGKWHLRGRSLNKFAMYRKNPYLGFTLSNTVICTAEELYEYREDRTNLTPPPKV